LLVSHVNRRYPLEEGNELVSKSPRPDQDPACSQIMVCSAGLGGGRVHEGRRNTTAMRNETRGMRRSLPTSCLIPESHAPDRRAYYTFAVSGT
jgi:hypothetical protein